MPVRLPARALVLLVAFAVVACSGEEAPAPPAVDDQEPARGGGAGGSPPPEGPGVGEGGEGPVAPPDSPVAKHGALSVKGGKIVGADGAPVALRGMSLFWSQWSSTFWNPSVVATLRADWGSTVVRAAMGVDSGGYVEDAAREKARVTTVVDAAIAEGMYVVIDWHDHDANVRVDAAKTFFGEMADAYGKSPNVIFEIWNEPVYVSWSDVRSYAETVTATIRARGAQNLVIVGSPHWSQDVDVAADDPVTDTNTAYAIHFYANTEAHQAPLRAKAQAALDKGLALFASEWGTSSADGNGAVNEAQSTVWLDFLKERDIGWCNWSLFDKPEAASALVSGASTTGPWDDAALTASGKYVKARIASP